MSLTQTSSVNEGLSPRQRADLALAQGPLEKARTLPPWVYTDAAFRAAEEKYVLRREWHSLGRVEELPEVGDYFTKELLGEPLIVVRAADGEIQTLSAVCRHRGAVIATDRGNANKFVCPYHAWAYDTSGRLMGAPMMEGNAGFDKKQCALPQVRTEIWQGWIFVNFDPDAEPLAPRLTELDEILAPYGIPDLVSATEPLVYEQHYNWKLLTDNWENYHGIGTHANSLLTIPAFQARSDFPWEQGDAYSIWFNPFKGEFPRTLIPFPDVPPELNGYVGVHVFPSHLMLLSPADMIYFKFLHHSVDHFRLEAQILVLPEVVKDASFKQQLVERRSGLDYIHREEDAAVLEGCQAGVSSSLAAQGYLSPEERSQWHFYNSYLLPKVLEGLEKEG